VPITFVVRVERLVIEAGGTTFTVDLHRKLTVVAGMGTVERESLIGEVIGSLGGARPGVHLEVEDDKGRHLAVFRPNGARARIVDIDTVQDVSREFRTHDGRLDLLAPLGIEPRSARRLMRLTSADLVATAAIDDTVEKLASVPQADLWGAANRLRAADDLLASEAEAVGSAPEDAEIIDRIERHHSELEAALDRQEQLRLWTVLGGGFSALAAVPVAWVYGALAAPLLAVALTMGAISAWYRLRISRARRAEEQALAEAGVQSYLGFHLQRVNGLLANDAHRKRLMHAAEERRVASADWKRLAGDVPIEWAIDHREQIATVAAERGGAVDLNRLAAVPTISRDRTTELAHSLVTRITEVRKAGVHGESLPLVLDDPFRDVEASMKPLLLELLSTAAGTQIIYLTEDEDVASWARLEALTGELSIIEPAPEAHEPEAHARGRRGDRGALAV
jgi:hypothetical protein